MMVRLKFTSTVTFIMKFIKLWKDFLLHGNQNNEALTRNSPSYLICLWNIANSFVCIVLEFIFPEYGCA